MFKLQSKIQIIIKNFKISSFYVNGDPSGLCVPTVANCSIGLVGVIGN